MHEQPPPQSARTRDAAPMQGENEPAARPRIYVASLADYNAGHLHGVWLDAAREPDELQQDIDAMLRESPEPGAEEWAIHDHEGFWSLRLSEFTSLDTTCRLAHGIAAHGEPFAAFADWLGQDDATIEAFERHYQGTWESLEAYTEQFLDALDGFAFARSIPSWLQPYVRIDIGAFGRDLELSGDIYTAEMSDGIAVFDAHA